MTVATIEDVEQALTREVEDDERGFVQPMLDYVEALIHVRLPEALDRAGSDDAYRIVVARVEAEAAARVLRAPGGGLFKYETEGTYTYSINEAIASGALELRPADWAVLSSPGSGWGGGDGPRLDGYVRRRFRPLRPGEHRMSQLPYVDPMPPPGVELGVRGEGRLP